MCDESVTLLDKVREVSQLTEFHDQVYVCACFLTIYQSDDVRMMKAFEDVDLGVEVLFQFFIELLEVDGLDGHESACFLRRSKRSATRPVEASMEYQASAGNRVHV
jgi:hypothetical protein